MPNYCTIAFLIAFKKIIFVFSFLAVLGLHCCMSFSLVVATRGYIAIVVYGLLIEAASPVVEHEL